MSIESRRRAFSIGFALLLALSVLWPEPVVDINRLCCHANLGIDELSFLGREAPRWDVVFWCIAGLFTIALLQKGADYRAIVDEAKSVRLRRPHVATLAALVLIPIVWMWLDAPLIAFSESIDSPGVETVIRYANRFGGGLNPAMIVGFFVLAGAAFADRLWIWCGVAMAAAGAMAGVFVQIVKFAVGRTRPELWLGAFHHARASATSFPSGHTVGAFALGGVLMLHARSRGLRVAAFALAALVAVSRVLAFRHWPSDVVASAVIGMICAAAIVRLLRPAPRS